MANLQQNSNVNLSFGYLRVVDYFVITYCIIRISVWELPVFLLTYPFVYTSSTRFATEIQNFLVRITNHLLNPAVIRFLTRPASEHITTIVFSTRYKRYRENINHLVTRPTFTGYWILQHSLECLKVPSESDITIFYLHGGGYFSSQPAHYLLFLLRLAEPILKSSSVSIFALDYSLAPEHVFPKQLEEAVAAYKYLIDEQHISPEKLIVMGDSAGGHLALSLLVSLKNSLKKPGGLVLMSPWLSLQHESSSFITNAHTDVLSGPFLRTTARRFLGPSPASNMNSPYLEFLTPNPTIDWEAILPSWIWVSAGENEVLIDNVKLWVGILKERLGEERVSLEVGARKVHVWQWFETMIDEPMKKAFLAGNVGDERGFEATASVGRAILERVKRAQAVSNL